MRIAFASGNPGKLRELRVLLPDCTVEPLDLSGIAEETGETFLDNARMKAQFARNRAPGHAWALGEDSGLEVDGLDGAPGVRSARFAGVTATDDENLHALLTALEDMEGYARRGRYVCELVLLAPNGEEIRARGTLEGSIARRPSGSGGFGYDPVFVPVGESATVAELGDEWKAARSHRATAARALRAELDRRA